MNIILIENYQKGYKIIEKFCYSNFIPKKTYLAALVIFNKVLYEFDTQYDLFLPYVCCFLASKIEETHIKFENMVSAIQNYEKKTITLQTMTFIETLILEKINYKFDALHIHFYVAKICNTLNIDHKEKFKIVDEMYINRKINEISIIDKNKFHPLFVALCLFDDKEIVKIENLLIVEFDSQIIRDARNFILN